ncbi:hypothetical protein PS870_00493 [Pseudomonas fluorescens]|uniref:Phage tail assembly chaperone-like domain-containing protein n=1 Tax=Pseudomonas fluorescens TaxID=294 RepID=A0A5E7GT34_PSEFL|nr:phage tail assembly chaperone [Pseudomonas fluorescens]VVO55069.1 hypothetical protein PS870_00493 [Pseudomonas fluorescens]
MRTVKSVKNPVWADVDHTTINLTVLFEELETTYGEVPFTATADAPEDITKELYANALKGEYGDIADYAPIVLSADELAARARVWRDQQVLDNQWLVERHRDQLATADTTTLTSDQFKALLTYRQGLRDWPQAKGFPAESSRPVKPEWLPVADVA